MTGQRRSAGTRARGAVRDTPRPGQATIAELNALDASGGQVTVAVRGSGGGGPLSSPLLPSHGGAEREEKSDQAAGAPGVALVVDGPNLVHAMVRHARAPRGATQLTAVVRALSTLRTRACSST